MELNFLCKSACGRARIKPPRGPRSADRIGDGAKARKVDDTRIRRESRHDHLGSMLLCEAVHLVVIDDAGLWNDPVLHRFEELAGEIDLGAMGQMAAMIEAHP